MLYLKYQLVLKVSLDPDPIAVGVKRQPIHPNVDFRLDPVPYM